MGGVVAGRRVDLQCQGHLGKNVNLLPRYSVRGSTASHLVVTMTILTLGPATWPGPNRLHSRLARRAAACIPALARLRQSKLQMEAR